MELVLGIDLGTHGARVLAVDRRGVIYGQGSSDYLRRTNDEGLQEQPLDPVWDAFCMAVKQCAANLTSDQRITGMAVTHQRGTVAALDESGKALGPAICDSDMRSLPQAQSLAERIGTQHLYTLTGCPPLSFNGLTKILWWLQHSPPDQRINTFASVQDWAVLRLTGQALSSPGSALRLGVLDISDWSRYAEELLVELGLNPNRLMPLRPYNQALGSLTTKAAAEMGLQPCIPVFPSPGDQPAAMLGTGAIVEQDAVINLGTSFLISFPHPDFPAGGADYLCTLETLPDHSYAIELGTGVGTNILDWLRDELLQIPSVHELASLADRSPPGARGLRIFSHWWPALVGDSSCQFHNLRSIHTRADIVRATIEGLACEVRWSWEQLQNAVNDAPGKSFVFGGASQHDLLCQILSNTLNIPACRTITPEASALGAAISAATGVGWYASLRETASSMTKLEETFYPTSSESRFYNQVYNDYLESRSSGK